MTASSGPKRKLCSPDIDWEMLIDPLGLDAPDIDTSRASEAIAIPTGISDEEDAGRHLALQLDPEARFCIECETYHRVSNFVVEYCPTCDRRLYAVGAAPMTKHRYKTRDLK